MANKNAFNNSFISQHYLDCRVLKNPPFNFVLSENYYTVTEDNVRSFFLLFSWGEGEGIIPRNKPVEQNISVQGNLSY